MDRTDHQAPKDEGEATVIILKVKSADVEYFFKCKMTTPLTKIMNAFCKQQGVTMD